MTRQFYRKPNNQTGVDDLIDASTNQRIGSTEFGNGAGFSEANTAANASPEATAAPQRDFKTSMTQYASSPLQDFKSRNKLLELLKEGIRRKQGNNKDIQSARNYWRTKQGDPQSFVDKRIQLLNPSEQRSLRDYGQAVNAARLRGLDEEEKNRGDRLEDIIGGVKDIQGGKLDEAREARINRSSALSDLSKYDSLGITAPDSAYNAIGMDVRNGRTGASLSYINNNPGNLKYADWEGKYYSATKDPDSAFARFPSVEKAHEAYRMMLTSKDNSYTGMTPDEKMWHWSGEGKDTQPSYTYKDLVKLGAPAVSKPFEYFTDNEWKQFFEAQKKREGWDEGTPVTTESNGELKLTESEKKNFVKATGKPYSYLKDNGIFSYDDYNKVMNNAKALARDNFRKAMEEEHKKNPVIFDYSAISKRFEKIPDGGLTSTEIKNILYEYGALDGGKWSWK